MFWLPRAKHGKGAALRSFAPKAGGKAKAAGARWRYGAGLTGSCRVSLLIEEMTDRMRNAAEVSSSSRSRPDCAI